MGRGLWMTGDADEPGEMPDAPEIVLFRQSVSGLLVLAVFPEDEDAAGRCSWYADGCHSAGIYEDLIADTHPATPEQYGPLKAKLEEMGYILDVREQYTLEGR